MIEVRSYPTNYVVRGTFRELKQWRDDHMTPKGAFLDEQGRERMVLSLEWGFPGSVHGDRERHPEEAAAVLRLRVTPPRGSS